MLTQTKYSSKFYPDAVTEVKKEGNFFIFITSETILEARVMTDKIIRFRYAADGFFQKDFSYAVSKYFDEKLSITCQINRQNWFAYRGDLKGSISAILIISLIQFS